MWRADSVFPAPDSPLTMMAWLRPLWIIARCAALAISKVCGGSAGSEWAFLYCASTASEKRPILLYGLTAMSTEPQRV